MYYRLCNGLVDQGTLVPTTEDIYSKLKTLKNDAYQSVYLYNEEQKKRFYEEVEEIQDNGEIKTTIKGVRGVTDVFTHRLVFDFDGKDLDEARRDTITTVERLVENGVPVENILAFFSGNKGFGLEILFEDDITPTQHKLIGKSIAGDLKTFDPVVYNASRILRIPFTKHQISHLYKIPLQMEELNSSIVEIKKLAKEEFEPSVLFPKAIKIPEGIKKIAVEPPKKEVKVVVDGECDLDLYKKPKWLSAWKYALSEGYFPEGMRNSALMILGATYAGQGINKITAYRMLKGAAELQHQRTGQERYADEEIWSNIITQVYSRQWSGGTYAEKNFPDNLRDYLEGLGLDESKVKDTPLTGVDDVFSVFENFAQNIEKNTIKTGIKELDDKCRITTSMLVGLLGAPGAGKTASILNILNSHSLGGEASVFFSLDMGKPLVYQKMAQKFTGYNSDKIFEIFQNNDQEKKQKMRYQIKSNFSNVQMCFRTGATVDNMKQYIQDYEEESGKKVRLIAVDYLEKIVGPFSDPTANSGYNAAKLQELANELELCVLLLLQPQKMAGDPSDPLLTYRRVKGASVIEQDCRVIISVFREGYHPQTFENDDFITYAVLKNTMGQLGTVDCLWDGQTGGVFEIDDLGRADLKKIRKLKAEKKALESF